MFVKKQKEFLNGETKKQGKLSKKDTKIVKTMEEAMLLKKLLVRVLKLSTITELIVTKRVVLKLLLSRS